MNNEKIFENLFVLEMANNHLGKLDRGLEIIQQYASVVHRNGVKVAMKLQFRDVDNFIHKDYKGNTGIRYVKKTEDTKLSHEDYAILVKEIKNHGMIPMATPFDEASVDLCVELGTPIIKMASSDVNDWFLIKKIAQTKLPVLASSGGASEKNLDALVAYFDNRNISIAINHCIAMYPSEDYELDLDQIDYLRNRYPTHIIGLSTHEYTDWRSSMLISYAKGARTWERHVDIDYEGVKVSPYCSLPYQIEEWFQAYQKAKEMCGGKVSERRFIPKKETQYLDNLVRGVYAKRDLSIGYKLYNDSMTKDFYLAIPLQKGQLSCRELMNGDVLVQPIQKDAPLMLTHLAGYTRNDKELSGIITDRGI